MKANELREMSDEQLGLTLQDAVNTLFRMRIKSQTEPLNAPSELRKRRRLIARIKTLQTQRSTAAAAKQAAANPAPPAAAPATKASAAPAAKKSKAAEGKGADKAKSAAAKSATAKSAAAKPAKGAASKAGK